MPSPRSCRARKMPKPTSGKKGHAGAMMTAVERAPPGHAARRPSNRYQTTRSDRGATKTTSRPVVCTPLISRHVKHNRGCLRKRKPTQRKSTGPRHASFVACPDDLPAAVTQLYLPQADIEGCSAAADRPRRRDYASRAQGTSTIAANTTEKGYLRHRPVDGNASDPLAGL